MKRTAKTSQLIFATALTIGLSVASVGSVWGDAAPPLQPPGSNIKPGGDGTTQVSMVSERVELDVRTPQTDGQQASAVATALVTATFNMRNLGEADEILQVRFPLEEPRGNGDGYGRYPEVQNFVAYANGEMLPTLTVTEPLTRDVGQPDKTGLKWASFEVSFPVRQAVVISVTYVISASQRDPDANFYYVLETGAGWRGRIGRADFVVRLPYAVTPLNVYLTNAKTTLGARPTVRGNTLSWSRTNLEPTDQDNIHLMMISPQLWRNVLSAEAAAKATPNDADAVRGLARAYYTLVDSRRFPDGPMRTFAEQAETAYQKAISLQPANTGFRIEYAELLRDIYFFEYEYGGTDLGIRKTTAAIDQLEAVFELEPQNVLGIGILKDLEQSAQYASGNSQNQTERQKQAVLAILERIQDIKVKFGIAIAVG